MGVAVFSFIGYHFTLKESVVEDKFQRVKAKVFVPSSPDDTSKCFTPPVTFDPFFLNHNPIWP